VKTVVVLKVVHSKAIKETWMQEQKVLLLKCLNYLAVFLLNIDLVNFKKLEDDDAEEHVSEGLHFS
jgi:hypothetical protein